MQIQDVEHSSELSLNWEFGIYILSIKIYRGEV